MECLKLAYVTAIWQLLDYDLLLFTAVIVILSSNTSVVFDEQKFAFLEQKSGY
jgi:hypothetical protein